MPYDKYIVVRVVLLCIKHFTMSNTSLSFVDNIAMRYEELLGPFLFEPFAADLEKRVRREPATNVLELACGTGRLTRRLAAALAPGATLTATDISLEMLAVARETVGSMAIWWAEADMTALPFADGEFDLVVAQFGLMFAADHSKALQEAKRVLRKGGRLLFNSWAPAAENPVWIALGQSVRSVLGDGANVPMDQPFSLADEGKVLQLMEENGFHDVTASLVRLTCSIESAAAAAQGMVEGLPVINIIRARAPQALPKLLELLEQRYAAAFGDSPMVAPVSARVFEGRVLLP